MTLSSDEIKLLHAVLLNEKFLLGDSQKILPIAIRLQEEINKLNEAEKLSKPVKADKK